ncbi:hypothetical protein KKE92_04385 [Candidatus Micrarchaeota archaeon]|nr:hypothetical protein [Candidatus Micrarchaeota archaeon]
MSEPAKVKENSDVRKEGKEGAEGNVPKKRTVFSRMKVLVASLAVATTFGLATEACSGSDENPPPLPVDGSVVDGGDLDADTDTDADTDSGTDTDSGPDVDSGIVDGGETDSGPDVDGGDTDSGTVVCDPSEDSVGSETLLPGESVIVGGYEVTYNGQSSNGADITVSCGGTVVDSNVDCHMYQVTEIPDTGNSMQVEVEVHSAGNVSGRISVEVVSTAE